MARRHNLPLRAEPRRAYFRVSSDGTPTVTCDNCGEKRDWDDEVTLERRGLHDCLPHQHIWQCLVCNEKVESEQEGTDG